MSAAHDRRMNIERPAIQEPVTPTPDQQRALARWRALALDHMPYMASMLFALHCCNFGGVDSFAVDRRMRLYVNFAALAEDPETWTDSMCAQALLHECCHLFHEHAERAADAGVGPDDRDHWNSAADAEINDDLRDAGCAELAAYGILPAALGQPDHRCAEVYYAAASPSPAQPPGTGAPGDRQRGATGGEPYPGCGPGAGGGPIPGAPSDRDDAADGGPAGTGVGPIERRRVRIATAASIRDYAAIRGRGSIPAGLHERATDTLAPPTVPWQQVLRADLSAATTRRRGNTDADWTRQSRRRRNIRLGAGRVIYPGTYSPQPRIAAVRDTSGSMSASDLAAVTAEIVGIAAALGIRGRDLRVLDVDAAVHEVVDYQGAVSISHVRGRGGTDMRVGIRAALSLRPAPSAVVVLTDGETPWPDQPTRVPVIAAIVAGRTTQPPNWVRTVRIDPPPRPIRQE